jgi:2-polyprenyl-6-methoxyphenol hydroxylase-like FAD-dependent oxidoreductase
MKRPLRIAIVGYGTAGQALALALSADEHHVEVFERVPDPGPVGAGFLLQPTGLCALWSLGLLPQALAHGAPVHRLYGETTAARPVMDMRYRELHPALYGLGMQRGAIFRLLDAAWREARILHSGREIVRIDHDRGVLYDASGEAHGAFDLIAVADGAASQLRTTIGELALDRPYPWGALWCLVPAADWPWADELRQRYRRARRMVGMLPVGTRPDDPVPRLSFFWSVPAAALAEAGRDADRWREDVAEVWPEVLPYLRDTAIPDGLAQARYRDSVLRRWHRGRAVLVGDAAHAMSPQLGQGANMALLDALALRDALRAALTAGLDPTAALPAYERARRVHLRMYHLWSRWLTPLFQSEYDTVAALRDIVFHPLSRIPGSRGQSLRILTGTRRGWFGAWPLPDAFLRDLRVQAPGSE